MSEAGRAVHERVDRPGAEVVSCRALTKRYGDLVAVDGVTFSLEPGTVTGFLGPNGAGKTTTLRLLLGLAEPTAGDALVFRPAGQDLLARDAPAPWPRRSVAR
jgi:ABC-type multidrug transport system ATPase subunit